MRIDPGRRAIFVVVTVLTVAATATLFAVNQRNQSKSANDQNTSETATLRQAVTDPGNQAAPTADTTITISANGFSPAEKRIARGTTITWQNTDSQPHAVDPAPGSTGPHSQQLTTGDTYSYSFQTTGTYKYIDPLNPAFSGTITVVNPEQQ